MTDESRDWVLKALTPIWTGNASGKNSRVIPTGLLGSIRWWFEVVVRGLEGSACDPSDTANRCPDKGGSHCVVCELFGCTGWARKFRFQVLDKDVRALPSTIQTDMSFRLRRVPLRIVLPEEWALIDLTLRLIAGYGALGGKTTYKPSDEPGRENKEHHWDYGLIEITQTPTVAGKTLHQLKAHVSGGQWRTVNHGGAAWASLEHFWCVNGRYLARQNGNRSTFNRVIGRPETKSQAGGGDSWLAGRRVGQDGKPESKKVFSFKDPRRTFGFVNPGELTFDQLKTKLRAAWPDLQDEEFVTGDRIPALVLGKGSQT